MGFRRHRTTGMGEKMAHTPKFFEVCAIEGYSSRSKLFLDRLLPSRACLCFILTMKCKQPSLFSPRKFSTVFRLLEGSLSSYFMRAQRFLFHIFIWEGDFSEWAQNFIWPKCLFLCKYEKNSEQLNSNQTWKLYLMNYLTTPHIMK